MLARGYLAERHASLVYASPERLSTSRFRALVHAGGLARIVVDEAHCISEWGHDFRPAYRQIAAFAAVAGRPPIAAFTATATPETRSDIRRQLGLTNHREFVQPVDRPNLRWSVTKATSRAPAFEALRRELSRTGRGAAVVYASTRAQTIAIAAATRRSGCPAEAYHAGLSADRKRRVQQAFMSVGGPVIVATCAFGMGIDHPHVRLVCHVGAPGALETYVQEAGRAGRDGEPARCVLVSTPADARLHRARIREMARPARHWARRRLQAMEAYVDESACRRAAVSRYFGQSAPACRGCDLCDARRAPGNRNRLLRVHTVSGIQ
jgi:ATP-dependent DNA helicase RecQ